MEYRVLEVVLELWVGGWVGWVVSYILVSPPVQSSEIWSSTGLSLDNWSKQAQIAKSFASVLSKALSFKSFYVCFQNLTKLLINSFLIKAFLS